MNKHKFPYKWYLKDGYPSKDIEPNNLNVFGTFICGGGSTMGYNFNSIEPKYLIGMSVPPVMAAQIAHQIYLQWFKKEVTNG